MTVQLIPRIQERLKGPLPGQAAHLEMAPLRRQQEASVPPHARKSGVLILLYPDAQEELHLVLMKRTEDGHAHSGQISFPGGKWEQSDPDYVYTALREAEEEVGVPAAEVQVMGTLSRLYIPPSNFLVYPTLGFMPSRPAFVPDPLEVAAILEVKARFILEDTYKGQYKVTASGGFSLNAPGYQIQGHTIWGATAMMLAEFAAVCRESMD